MNTPPGEKEILNIDINHANVHLFPVEDGFVGICENDPRTIVVNVNPTELEYASLSLIQTTTKGEKMPIVLTTMSYDMNGVSSFPICTWPSNQAVPFGFIHYNGYLYSTNKRLFKEGKKPANLKSNIRHIRLDDLTQKHVFIPKPRVNLDNIHFAIELCSGMSSVVVNKGFIWESRLGKRTDIKTKLQQLNFLDVVKWFTIADLQCQVTTNVFPKVDEYDDILEQFAKDQTSLQNVSNVDADKEADEDTVQKPIERSISHRHH